MPGDPAKMDAELARLGELDFATLKARWRSATGRAAPAGVQRSLLLKILAYRLQAEAFGDLDPDTARFLDRVVSDRSLAGAGRNRAEDRLPHLRRSPTSDWTSLATRACMVVTQAAL